MTDRWRAPRLHATSLLALVAVALLVGAADQAYQAGMPELSSTSAIGTVVLLLLVAVFALVPAASATVSAVRTMKEPVTDLRGALAVAAYTAVVGVAIALLLGFGAATAEGDDAASGGAVAVTLVLVTLAALVAFVPFVVVRRALRG